MVTVTLSNFSASVNLSVKKTLEKSINKEDYSLKRHRFNSVTINCGKFYKRYHYSNLEIPFFYMKSYKYRLYRSNKDNLKKLLRLTKFVLERASIKQIKDWKELRSPINLILKEKQHKELINLLITL